MRAVGHAPNVNGMELDQAIRTYYETRTEEDRLQSGPSQLEAVRTRELIERFIPAVPQTVLDVGGAAGAYALWLAEAGHTVHLLDPVERLVREAERRSASASHPLASCRVGDARALPYEDGSVDVVLMLGPLYHLTEAADRVLALSQAKRVLRARGLVFAAAISRWAAALDAVARDLYVQPGHEEIAHSALADGQHRNPTGRPGGFTRAYFHRPDDLACELAEAGFDVDGVFALEGMAGFLPAFGDRWADPRQRANILRLARELEREPFLLGATPHMLAVGRIATPV